LKASITKVLSFAVPVDARITFRFFSVSMLRTQLARSVARTGRVARGNSTRTFVATPQRGAEVQLTIGRSLDSPLFRSAFSLIRVSDGKKVSIEGMRYYICYRNGGVDNGHSWFRADSGL